MANKGVRKTRFVRAVVGSIKPSLLSIGDSSDCNGALFPILNYGAQVAHSEGKVRSEPFPLCS